MRKRLFSAAMIAAFSTSALAQIVPGNQNVNNLNSPVPAGQSWGTVPGEDTGGGSATINSEVVTDTAPDQAAPDDVHATVVTGMSTARAVALVRELPEDQAEVITLRVLGQLEVTEVAELVGKTPNHVRVLTHRGLRRWSRKLEPAEPHRSHPRWLCAASVKPRPQARGRSNRSACCARPLESGCFANGLFPCPNDSP